MDVWSPLLQTRRAATAPPTSTTRRPARSRRTSRRWRARDLTRSPRAAPPGPSDAPDLPSTRTSLLPSVANGVLRSFGRRFWRRGEELGGPAHDLVLRHVLEVLRQTPPM